MNDLAIQPMFPPELLTSSLAERIQYFTKDAIVELSSLNEYLERLSIFTSYPTSRNLVLVIGPTGAGKTTLLKRLNSRIRSALTEDAIACGQVGSIYLELEPPEKGAFDFQVLHRAALLAMRAPLVDKTRPIVHRDVDGIRIPTLLVAREVRELRGAALKMRFNTEVDARKAQALILDEAGAIFKIARPRDEKDRFRRLKEQADQVKGMANATSSTVVLGGAYDFFDMSLSSGQNARRTVIVHVRPYDSSPLGLAGFASAIASLLCHLPIRHRIDPSEAATELFLQGLGCVGSAAGILTEGLREAILSGKDLDMKLIRKHYYPAQALNTMRKEMEDGMARVGALIALEDLAGDVPNDRSMTASGSAAGPDKPLRDGRHLKPGETVPSHMHGKTGAW